jgi:hypothetical protein
MATRQMMPPQGLPPRASSGNLQRPSSQTRSQASNAVRGCTRPAQPPSTGVERPTPPNVSPTLPSRAGSTTPDAVAL